MPAPARTAAAHPQSAVQDGAEMTPAETGAFIGSVALSPGGVPGVVVGGAIGFAAGMLVEAVDDVRSRVTKAYATIVKNEERAAAQQQHARETLEAIETISVCAESDVEAEALSRQLGEFLLRPANRRCADCAAQLQKRSDAWISTNLGVVLCINCAAAHRSLGTSISRIKSPVFDRCEASAIVELLTRGNDHAVAMYYHTPPSRMLRANSPMLERQAHAREKYVRMRWATAEARSARQAQLETYRAAKKKQPVRKRKETSRRDSQQPMPSLSSE